MKVRIRQMTIQKYTRYAQRQQLLKGCGVLEHTHNNQSIQMALLHKRKIFIFINSKQYDLHLMMTCTALNATYKLPIERIILKHPLFQKRNHYCYQM
ncbi:hypothetical protein D3C71_1971070 [compost metagenome]